MLLSCRLSPLLECFHMPPRPHRLETFKSVWEKGHRGGDWWEHILLLLWLEMFESLPGNFFLLKNLFKSKNILLYPSGSLDYSWRFSCLKLKIQCQDFIGFKIQISAYHKHLFLMTSESHLRMGDSFWMHENINFSVKYCTKTLSGLSFYVFFSEFLF